MSFGFDNIPERKGYLRQAGLQLNATFIGLSYNATEAYEYFDIEFETEDGRMFRERTFGPNIDKVFPKAKYENGEQVGTETKQEAFDRLHEEISRKLYYLATCFVKPDALAGIKGVSQLKTVIDKMNQAIAGHTEKRVNFLTIWKNSPSKEKSNLIIADKVKWCEATKYDGEGKVLPATITLTSYQKNNCMVEQYPYNGSSNESVKTDAPIIAGGGDDLPF
jgi:hypothetical protein